MVRLKRNREIFPENPLDTPWPLKYTHFIYLLLNASNFLFCRGTSYNRSFPDFPILLSGCGRFLEDFNAALLEQKILVFKKAYGLRHEHEAGLHLKILRAETGTIS